MRTEVLKITALVLTWPSAKKAQKIDASFGQAVLFEHARRSIEEEGFCASSSALSSPKATSSTRAVISIPQFSFANGIRNITSYKD